MFASLLILAASAAPQTADPLAEARAGKIRCVMPNIAAKTCMGFARITVKDEASYETVATLLVAPTPLITLEVTTSGGFSNGMLCSVIDQADFANAKVMMDGAPAADAISQAVLAQIIPQIEPMNHKMACAREHRDGDVIVAEAFINGAASPALDQRFIWVKPDEGYKLGQ